MFSWHLQDPHPTALLEGMPDHLGTTDPYCYVLMNIALPPLPVSVTAWLPLRSPMGSTCVHLCTAQSVDKCWTLSWAPPFLGKWPYKLNTCPRPEPLRWNTISFWHLVAAHWPHCLLSPNLAWRSLRSRALSYCSSSAGTEWVHKMTNLKTNQLVLCLVGLEGLSPMGYA